MATRSAPSTPMSNTTPSVPSEAPTGTWVHPKFDEIYRRKNAMAFGDRNIQTIAWNVLIFVAALILPSLHGFKTLHPGLEKLANFSAPYAPYILLLLRALPLLGIAYACSPLLRSKDDLSDIPLTPSQRALLGLEPSSRPPTPGSSYITPPRYARSPTPRSSSGSQTGLPFSGSHFNGKDSFGASRIRSAPRGSYSPTASPLLHKAVGRDSMRRLSLGGGTPSPLSLGKSMSESTSSALVVNTPTPASRAGSSVGLNNRWLYEKGRSMGSRSSVYS